MTAARQCHFEVNGLSLAAQRWGSPQGRPVLALHGWLDNSASFFRLAPLLKNLDIVALDMAGHGQSCHRPGSAPYNIWEDIAEILVIADALGWQEFTLLGHSRGAIISALIGAAFPQRVSALALIEGLFPEPVDPQDAPQQLAKSVRKTCELASKPLRVFASVEAAVKARVQGMFPLSEAAARALTERGVKPVAGGYTWSTDQRLLAPSAFKLTREQIHAFVAAIKAPTRLLVAHEGMPRMFPGFTDTARQYPHLDIHELAGGHHLHMEQQVATVAELINDFL